MFFLKFWSFLQQNNLETFFMKQSGRFGSFLSRILSQWAKNSQKWSKIAYLKWLQRRAPWIVGKHLKIFLVLSMFTSICHCCFLPKQGGFINEQKSGIFSHCEMCAFFVVHFSIFHYCRFHLQNKHECYALANDNF